MQSAGRRPAEAVCNSIHRQHEPVDEDRPGPDGSGTGQSRRRRTVSVNGAKAELTDGLSFRRHIIISTQTRNALFNRGPLVTQRTIKYSIQILKEYIF